MSWHCLGIDEEFTCPGIVCFLEKLMIAVESGDTYDNPAMTFNFQKVKFALGLEIISNKEMAHTCILGCCCYRHESARGSRPWGVPRYIQVVQSVDYLNVVVECRYS